METNPIIILGATGIGKTALEIFKSNRMDIYCFLDDNPQLHQTEINNVSVLGSTDDDGFLKFIGKKCDAFIATDDNKVREKLAEMLQERRKVMPTNAVHSNATISIDASIGYGNLVNAQAVINTGANIGNNCIINAGAVIENDAQISNLVQVGTNAVIGSGCKIETGAFIGTGAIIISGITIGKNARIGAGSVVIADVKAGETVFGNPAQKV
jgi:sugar O-acyltransferase (sialic acid O-acetyltransferase NeuD family)